MYELIELRSQPGEYVIKLTIGEVESWIPVDEGNADYQTYLKSLEETK